MLQLSLARCKVAAANTVLLTACTTVSMADNEHESTPDCISTNVCDDKRYVHGYDDHKSLARQLYLHMCGLASSPGPTHLIGMKLMHGPRIPDIVVEVRHEMVECERWESTVPC